MLMSDQIQGGMAEAMRLIQEGELAEATAVIQRALGGSSLAEGIGYAPMASPDAPSGAGEPIDVESSVVDEAPHPRAASEPAAGRGPATALRPVASPPLFGGVPLTVPGGLPGLQGLPGAMPA